ncbi:efflux RND transporter periplasmic adaptor subunit [Candidatus Sumerlaeota bacterium]|nr:efflux RND transporter periplasmic adaptor subunit [Candidatus Sumerlaeota bacterium]
MKRTIIILIACVAVIIIGWFALKGGSSDTSVGATYFTVRKAPMTIDVMEAGSVDASNSLSIRSQVTGQTKIISIVPEGTIITKEDVDNEKILVQLDTADFENELANQELQVTTAEATLASTRESLEIQRKTNESNLNEATLAVKFALMDLQKYVGEKLANELVQGTLQVTEILNRTEDIGGEMLQTKRDLESQISLSQEEVTRAKNTYEGTEQLWKRGYVTEDELRADELAKKRREVELEQARLKLELFIKYEHLKQSEKLRSDYNEAEINLERVKVKNRAELSKAEVEFQSATIKHQKQLDQLKRIKDQIANSTIRAPQPGMVIYARQERHWGSRTDIEEGADIRERQEIIKIPDTSMMDMTVKVHESVIGRVAPGQPAEVFIDAMPEAKFKGHVEKVALLPDSQGWLNPNLKVYETVIRVDDDVSELKPGMSGRARILIKQIPDAIQIPIQAVVTENDKQYVDVASGSGITRREVAVGDYNDKFIEILSGLNPGDRVALRDVVETRLPGGNGNGSGPSKEEEGRPQEQGRPAPRQQAPGS